MFPSQPSSFFKIVVQDKNENLSTYEDRTSRIFPPAPTVPRMPGLVSGDTGFIDDNEDSFTELSNSSQQRFNILCSGDKDGSICFSIFGIFPIGKIVRTFLFFVLFLPSSVSDTPIIVSFHLLILKSCIYVLIFIILFIFTKCYKGIRKLSPQKNQGDPTKEKGTNQAR